MGRYNAGRKLTRRLADEVRHIAQKEDTRQEVIARVYGISTSHVSNIKAERRWGNNDPRSPNNQNGGK